MRRRSVALLLLVLHGAGACYTYQPITQSAPSSGERYAFVLSDAGRAAVSQQIGPSVVRLEGTLTSTENDEYALRVYEVEAIGGSRSHWAGENVRIRQGYVSNLQERRFSRKRTALAVGGAVLGAAVFMATRSLIGGVFGGGDSDRPSGSGSQGS